MVIKTELCEFTEYRVYPGRGQRYVTKDGKVHFFLSSKAASLFKNRLKPVKLRWTQNWRRMNKKGKTEEKVRRRSRKVQKMQKGYTGLSLEDLKSKRAPKASKKTEAEATKEHKDKAKKVAKIAAPAQPKVAQKVQQKTKVQVGGKR